MHVLELVTALLAFATAVIDLVLMIGRRRG
jgi:hypothetical protein